MTSCDKLSVMKSLSALFFTMATERLLSKMNGNKELPEPRFKMTPTSISQT